MRGGAGENQIIISLREVTSAEDRRLYRTRRTKDHPPDDGRASPEKPIRILYAPPANFRLE